MKKSILILTTICLGTFGAFAQVKPSGNRGGFSVKGGVNSANISITSGGAVDDAKSLTTFQVGIGVDFPLAEALSLQTGLMYTGKGSKSQQGAETSANYYRATTNPMYLELPLNLVGKIPLSSTTIFLIGAGPYAAAGISGENRTEGKIFNVAFKKDTKIKYSNDDPTTAAEENAGYGKLKRFDYGFNALAGLDFKKASLAVNYGYGLVKINSGTQNRDDDNNKHRVLSLVLGIKL